MGIGVFCSVGEHDQCARPSCTCTCHEQPGGKRFLVDGIGGRDGPLTPEAEEARARGPAMFRDAECPDCPWVGPAQGLGAHRNLHRTWPDEKVLCSCGYRAKAPQGLASHRRRCD